MEDQQYTIDIFAKYKHHYINNNVFSKYFYENTSGKLRKISVIESLEQRDVSNILNTIIAKNTASSNDDKLYSEILYILNKVSKLLQNNDAELKKTIGVITALPYSKLDHFQYLANLLIDKAINETTFCPIYASLCAELSPYYIEVDQSKKEFFKRILLLACQAKFETYITNYSKVSKEKFTGLMSFIGELYNKNLLNHNIVDFCFNKLGSVVENESFGPADGMASFIITIFQHYSQTNPEKSALMVKKINELIDNGKMHKFSKFALENALEVIESY